MSQPAYVIAAFYHFFDFPDFAAQQTPLLERLKGLGIKGSLLITSEGVNSTLAGTREAIDSFLHYLQTELIGEPIVWKESYADTQPFGKVRVRLKKETISLGEPVNLGKRGHYVEPKDWNDLIRRNDVVILDTRNDYEVNLGTFKGAIDPKIPTFKFLPEWTRQNAGQFKGKTIATFCTGGIRCEKYTAWMMDNGFDDVYHLKGGILQYFEDVPAEESLWDGECFVFDERIAVDHSLKPSETATLCLYCDHALTEADQKSPLYEKGVSCPHCHGDPKYQHDREPAAGRTKF
ncbi:rhodanese-related sulfurtransferase [Asticcacaulis sp. AND118]|uniref:oxygen-dependent tRNA uridine(34) hydroxylase TrhO n=1 Tax=Asticcacaulis sp. AND118 TaxID=2840468 RepID=UPI001CFFAEE3|nr:rhodanese-related sulfurtransferase [Asticcacaulis sp. AND118]UDF02567.1 rhodanese-related sulfurtransferase [Asticcacaulis sp. AND118]